MDMYPVAGGGAFIVHTGMSLLPWKTLYVPKPIRYDQELFKHHTDILLSVMI